MPNFSGQCAFLYLYCVYSFDIAIRVQGLFTCPCATRILAVASIHSAHQKVRQQFESGDYSRAVTNQERHLIEQIRYVCMCVRTYILMLDVA